MAGMAPPRRNGAEARKVAAEAYPYKCCVICGIRQDAVIDVCHMDQDPSNNSPSNLVYLCKTHHRMFDTGLYPAQGLKLLRSHWQKTMGEPDHSIYMKDAGAKAATTRKRQAAARRAVATRRARSGESGAG